MSDGPTILATSGGLRPGSRTAFEFAPLIHYGLELAGVTGRAPRLGLVATAVGLVYRGTRMVEAVSEVAGKGAYRLTRRPGGVQEDRIEPRPLPGGSKKRIQEGF